ncbi:hypothetical protein C0Q70_18224 [Pomacea canaliculata]|uniref:Protein kinase domain-containing protein n=1 Tax=Pomacea canaliculata TaxID=400727 RepID=A0A2T7NMN1_POMCA|nr:hypothetical protein C0Q70_18224 [Pomacea canaliculata]
MSVSFVCLSTSLLRKTCHTQKIKDSSSKSTSGAACSSQLVMMHKKSPTSLSSPSCKINCEDYTTCWTWGYRLLSCIAESQSGMSRVYRAVQLGEGNTTDDLPPPSSQVTIKVVESENSLSQQLLHTVLALSQKLPPHANILDITHYFSSARAEFIVSQTCRLGSLGIILSEKQYLGKGMAETSSKLIISQVCSGLTHLKMTGIPHGGVVIYVVLHGVLPFSSEDLDKMAKKENAPALCIRLRAAYERFADVQSMAAPRPQQGASESVAL